MSNDLNNRLPLYAQVEHVIISRISNGSLPPGTRLPSEDSLVQEYAVSRTTIRAAIQSLVQRGLVEIRRGKGTFVTHPKITQELTELTGFVEDMQALGRHAIAKVLDQQVVAANQVVARQLALPQGAPVVRIQRVRLADGMPLSFDETYLPKELGEKVMADQSRNRTDLLSSGAKIQHPAGGSRIPAGSRLRRRHSGEGALHWRRQRDLSDRANLLFDWASTGRLREATLPG